MLELLFKEWYTVTSDPIIMQSVFMHIWKNSHFFSIVTYKSKIKKQMAYFQIFLLNISWKKPKTNTQPIQGFCTGQKWRGLEGTFEPQHVQDDKNNKKCLKGEFCVVQQ